MPTAGRPFFAIRSLHCAMSSLFPVDKSTCGIVFLGNFRWYGTALEPNTSPRGLYQHGCALKSPWHGVNVNPGNKGEEQQRRQQDHKYTTLAFGTLFIATYRPPATVF